MLKLTATLYRRWPLLLALTGFGLVIGAISGFLSTGSSATQDQFRATQVIIARKGTNSILVPQDALKVMRGKVPDIAAASLGENTLNGSAVGGVTTTYEQAESSISVSCRRPSAMAATECAQAFVNAFLLVANQDSQQDDRLALSELNKSLSQVQADLQTQNTALAGLADQASEWPATLPPSSSTPARCKLLATLSN